MEQFIHNNNIWLIPLVSIVLTIVIKIASKSESITLNYVDWLNFGFDLSTSSTIVLFTSVESSETMWLLLFFMIVQMITAIIVNRLGWDKNNGQLKLIVGVLFPDLIGIILMVIATVYTGGK